MGLLEGQMAVATGNFNSSLQDSAMEQMITLNKTMLTYLDHLLQVCQIHYQIDK